MIGLDLYRFFVGLSKSAARLEDEEDLYFPQEANGVTIIYH